MSAAEQPFLDAILDRPDDDGPRLVYADFLDETGDPLDAARAELVRVQLALARLPADHPRRPELANRQADLLRHRDAWVVPVPGVAAEFQFRRGIPDVVSVDAAAFLARGGDLLRRARCVRRVRLLDPARVLPDLVHCPFLAAVEELDLSWGELGNGGVNVLVRSPHLKGLRALDLGSNGLDDAGVGVLARASTLPGLRELALNDNGPITADGVRALADSPFFAGLESLDLSGNEVTEAGVKAVAEGRAMTRLRALKLHGNPIGDAGVSVLARSDLLRRLLDHDPHLDLRANGIGPDGAATLAGTPALARAVSLDLGGNYLGDAGAEALARGRHLGGLQVLRLAQNQLTDAGAAALARSGLVGRLRLLDVSGNRITKRGVGLLAAAAGTGTTLDVSGNVGTPRAAQDPPVAVADVVNGVLTGLVDADEVAELKRRIGFPTRGRG